MSMHFVSYGHHQDLKFRNLKTIYTRVIKMLINNQNNTHDNTNDN